MRVLRDVIKAELFHVRLKLVNRVFILIVDRPPVVILTNTYTVYKPHNNNKWRRRV